MIIILYCLGDDVKNIYVISHDFSQIFSVWVLLNPQVQEACMLKANIFNTEFLHISKSDQSMILRMYYLDICSKDT